MTGLVDRFFPDGGIGDAAEAMRVEPIGAITAAELDALVFPPIRFVVKGYISEGCLTILAGKPKVGKSWLCLDISIAIATGGVAFGSIGCEAGDVLYAALEDNRRRLQRRVRQVMPLRQKPDRLTFWTEMPRLDAGGVDAIRAWIDAAESPRLVIVDVFARVRPDKKANETQYDADYRAVAGLQALASDTGVAIVIVSHLRKMEADDPLDSVSGTLGFTGAADTVLVSRRTEGRGERQLQERRMDGGGNRGTSVAPIARPTSPLRESAMKEQTTEPNALSIKPETRARSPGRSPVRVRLRQITADLTKAYPPDETRAEWWVIPPWKISRFASCSRWWLAD